MINITETPQYNKTSGSGFLAVKKVDTITLNPGRSVEKKFLCDYLFIHIREGRLDMNCNGTEYGIGKNCCFIAPVFSTVECYKTHERKSKFMAVYFSSTIDISSITSRVITISSVLTFQNELIRMVKDTYNPKIKDNARLESIFLALLYELENAETSTGPEKGVPIDEIAVYITENINRHFSMQDICDRFGYNKDYISRSFKKKYGVTVKEYANREKLEAAKYLLKNSRHSIKKVGEAVGFDSVELFYKFFRYHMKLTPFEYRKANR